MTSEDATITGIRYDAELLELRIAFAHEREIIHIGVPEAIHVAFLAADHQPIFYMTHIRDGYRRA